MGSSSTTEIFIITMRKRISYENLKQYLSYDPKTGVFIQLVKGYTKNRGIGSEIGTFSQEGYRIVTIYGISYKLCVLAYLYMMEEYPPKGYCVDHINLNKSDDRWENLRLATTRQNKQNEGILKTNTSGVKGVCWHKRHKKWIAQLRVNSIIKHIGYFSDLEEAKEAIRKARELYHGEYANHG